MNVKKTGRPKGSYKVKTPEEMERLIDEYRSICAETDRPFTLTGTLNHMGLYSRATLAEYDKRPGFSEPIKRLRGLVEQTYEERLHEKNPTGAIFGLKNMGWSDRQITEHQGDIAITLTKKVVRAGD